MNDVSTEARARRRKIAWDLASRLEPAVTATIAERPGEIQARFPSPERSLVLLDWPIGAKVAVACSPEVIEVLLDAIAEAFSPWLLEQVHERCLKSPPDTSSSSSSADG